MEAGILTFTHESVLSQNIKFDIEAFDNELDAFSAYADTFPTNSIFLIDTYDTLYAAKKTVKIATIV